MIKKRKKILLIGIVFLFVFLQSANVLAKGNNCKDKVPVFSVDTEEKKVALTFDLNWADPDEVYKILDVLDKYNVKSTFFVIGKWVQYPTGNDVKLKEVYKRGHEIANHSYEHPNFLKINRKQIAKEIVMTEKIIYDITGKNSKYFRFPSGAYTSEGVEQINSMGLTCVQWSKDSLDWKNRGLEIEHNNVMKDIKSGDIVLFHNNGKFTSQNLERIIPLLQDKGFKLVTVDEMLHKKEFFVDENGKQFKIN
ncbi:MAG: polysaccharide deacetylase family protein [Sarcina sp.]